MSEFGFVNYLDALRNTQVYGHKKESLADGRLHAVSVNKMRGLFSNQIKKWGSYQLRNIDYVMHRKCTPMATSSTFGVKTQSNSF